ncbi:MAG TPA: CARDB domain-containing protein [Vicinamibacterales bacterium]
MNLPVVLLLVCFLAAGACRQPDLTIESGPPDVDVSVTGLPGGSLRLGPWTVANRGGRRTGAVVGSYHLSPDAEVTFQDRQLKGDANLSIDGLRPGQTHTFPADPRIAIPDDVEPGTYYFGILVDGPNQVQESDESNNSAVVRIGIVRREE